MHFASRGYLPRKALALGIRKGTAPMHSSSATLGRAAEKNCVTAKWYSFSGGAVPALSFQT